MKSCEMHLVLVLSDHVNVGKDPLYRPPKTQKAEEGRTTQTTVYPHVKASGKFPGKNPRAQKAHLYAFKETFLKMRPLRPNLSATSLIRDTKKSMGHGRKVIEKPSLFH